MGITTQYIFIALTPDWYWCSKRNYGRSLCPEIEMENDKAKGIDMEIDK